MEQVSGLYNPGFVGSQFSWWLGQVADSTTWRDNQSDTSYDNREDVPGWGYRYKVRIMGIHDAGESEIPSDQLPWCQVMYSVWGGGQGGSFQTPGIKEGMFVFGFFLDGTDEQVPIIMGVLGNNAKTVIEGIGSEEGEPNTFMPKSFFKDDGTTIARASCVSVQKPASSGANEGTDDNNRNNGATKTEEEINKKERPIECPKHGNSLTSMGTHMSNFQKDYQGLMEKLNSYGSAAASTDINTQIDGLIEETSKLSAKSMLPSLNNTQNFLSKKLNDATRAIDFTANITDRLDNLEANVASQGKLGCVFNKIKGDLARLIGAAMRKSLARKQNQTPQNNNQTRPSGDNSNLIPPIPPEGFYTPTNPCETEEIIADVFSNVMGEITSGYQSALEPLTAGSGTASQGRLASALSQENVLANLENGKLFGGLASALAAGAGINASQSGAISSALKAGNYTAALTSLVDGSGKSAAIGGLASAIQSANAGDIVGAFRGLSGPLGVDSNLMGAVGGALGAIKGGNLAGLTNELGNLGGLAPNILTNVLGARLPLSGIDIGGFGAMGGLDFDMALASTFMSTAAAFLECDPPDECPVNDTHTLGGGGKKKDGTKEGLNVNNAMEKVEEKTVSDDKLKGIFDKATNKSGVSFNPLTRSSTSALNLSAPITPNLGIGDPNLINTASPFADPLLNVASNTQPLPETFSEYRNRTGNNNISEQSFTPTPKKKFNVPKIKSNNVEMIEFQEEVNQLRREGAIAEETGETDISGILRQNIEENN